MEMAPWALPDFPASHRLIGFSWTGDLATIRESNPRQADGTPMRVQRSNRYAEKTGTWEFGEAHPYTPPPSLR